MGCSNVVLEFLTSKSTAKCLAQVDKKGPETETEGCQRWRWKGTEKVGGKLRTSVGWDGNPMLGKGMSGETFANSYGGDMSCLGIMFLGLTVRWR